MLAFCLAFSQRVIKLDNKKLVSFVDMDFAIEMLEAPLSEVKRSTGG